MDCSFVDYAEGITHLESSIEYVDKIENDEVRDFLLRMLLCNAISVLDFGSSDISSDKLKID